MHDSQFEGLAERIRAFAAERDWEKFHTPKNLAMAISIEAGELMEHFLWTDSATSTPLTAERKEAVSHEMADVLVYLIRMAQITGVDLLKAADEKLKLNSIKYPADIV